MPNGAPSIVPAPKSGCRWFCRPMLATYAVDRACTGSRLTSACHTLSPGKIVHAADRGVGFVLGAGAAVVGGSTGGDTVAGGVLAARFCFGSPPQPASTAATATSTIIRRP